MSAKYKAHKLVNIIFYVVIFIFGFLMGLSSKIFDSANAYTITSINGTTIDEEFLYNKASSVFNDFDSILETHNLWKCSKNSTYNISCRIYPNNFLDIATYLRTSNIDSSTKELLYSSSTQILVYDFAFNLDNSLSLISSSNRTISANSIAGGMYNFGNSYNYTYYTNFDVPFTDRNSFFYNWNSNANVLDFSSFGTPEMVYDDELFDNDPNFKEVCVNNYDTFTITSNNITDYDENDNPLYHSNDFIWFKNRVVGVRSRGYDSETIESISSFDNSDNDFTDDPYGWSFYNSSQEDIDTFWNSPYSPGIELVSRGYTDKYKYYNYTFVPFYITLTTEYQRFSVFDFVDPVVISSNDDIIAITDINSTDSYSILPVSVDNPNKYCFYIKTEYDVNILTENSFGDYSSSINVLGDNTFHIETHSNEFNQSTNGVFSTITSFISNIRGVVNFINVNVANLYSSMPFIVRQFIIFLLAIIVIRLIIGGLS